MHGWIDSKLVTGQAQWAVPEGWVVLQMDFDAEGHARFTVLGMGTKAKVLEPKELRDWVGWEAEAMTKA